MSAIWSSGEIAAATRGQVQGDFLVSGAAFDSREVRHGDLFFALKGETSDGHLFVERALAQGAPAAVVSQPVAGPHILVPDTASALEDLARASRERARTQGTAIVAVTGSAGKTGVKEALYHALDRASRGHAHRSLKSYNNHVGVPLSLVRMPRDAAYGVFEMGMNHAGELSRLTALVRPHVAIVTTIAPAHIGHFSGEEAIADAKAEIFEGLEPGGTALIPFDNAHCERLRKVAERHAQRVWTFGTGEGADIRAIDTVPAPGGGTLVTALLGDRRLCYTVRHPGEHWVANSLAVIGAVHALRASLGAAGLALAELPDLAGRGARHRIATAGGEALLIDESYNANPASMRAAIAQLGAAPAGRRIAVLGAMKELGDFSVRFHAALAEPLIEAGTDLVIAVGDEMGPLADELGKRAAQAVEQVPALAHVADASAALAALRDRGLRASDAILVKGSNSVGLGKLVRALTGGEF